MLAETLFFTVVFWVTVIFWVTIKIVQAWNAAKSGDTRDRSRCAYCGKRLKRQSAVLGSIGGYFETCKSCGRDQPWAKPREELK